MGTAQSSDWARSLTDGNEKEKKKKKQYGVT